MILACDLRSSKNPSAFRDAEDSLKARTRRLAASMIGRAYFVRRRGNAPDRVVKAGWVSPWEFISL